LVTRLALIRRFGALNALPQLAALLAGCFEGPIRVDPSKYIQYVVYFALGNISPDMD
jgi:hypothetical protein